MAAAFALFLVFATSSAVLLAQAGLGNITGHVLDATGAVIPGAKVTITNNATKASQVSVSNTAGIYQAIGLNPGTYTVQAENPGFSTLIRPNVLVQSEDRIGLELRLKAGAAESVVVTTLQPQLNTEDAQTGEVVTNQMIETLPTLSGNNGRDPLSLIRLAGNVQGSGDRAGPNLGNGGNINSGQGDTRINGGRTGSVEYLIDGIPSTGGFAHNVLNDTPPIDAVQEFKVVTNGISAEFGRLSGGFVSLTTKAGTDSFHGQAFEYNQNSFLNANTWNNDALCANDQTSSSCKKPNFRTNDFGVAFGGPLMPWRHGPKKTFFFFDYDGIRTSTSGDPTVGQTLTAAERKGDLTDIGTGTTADPYARVWDAFGPISATKVAMPNGGTDYKRMQLAGGDGRHITHLDPTIQQYAALMPLPNRTPIAGSGTAGNFLTTQPRRISSDTYSFRMDQTITDKQRIYGRFTHSGLSNVLAPFYPTLGTSEATLLPGGWGLQLHYTNTLNNSTVLELQTGGNFSPFSTGTFLPGNIQSSSFGYGSTLQSLLGPSDIVRISQGPFTEGTSFGCGACQFSQGFNGNTGALVNTTNFQYAASLTKILGKHSVKFGYEGRRYYDNFTQQRQSNTSGGISDGYAFDAEATGEFIGQNQSWSPQGYANGVGQFLEGIDSWVRVTNKLGRSLSSHYYAAYVQDDFKVTPKLTLNLGVRWETETPVREKHDNLTVWNPNAKPAFSVNGSYSWAGALAAAGLNPSQVATPDWVTNGFAPGALQVVNTTDHPSRDATEFHPYNFAPRLGFSWSTNPTTVLRGSFALVYLPTSGSLSSYGDSPGVFYTTTANNQSTQGPPGANTGLQTSPPRTVANPWSDSQIATFTRSTTAVNAQAAKSGNGTGSVDMYSHMPHEFDWGLAVQQQFPNQWLFELQYSANVSNTLLSIGNPSHFPKPLYSGGPGGVNRATYTTNVASPTAGQIDPNSYTGPSQPLGVLEYKYPYYGPVIIEDQNTGKSHYESMNARLQHRFVAGLQILANYTWSKSLDDTGGSDNYLGNPGQGSGTGGKPFQQVDDSVNSVYGLSPLDETHRMSLFYNYQLPFGKGRKMLNHGDGFGYALLNDVVGGWELAGISIFRSGRPVTISTQGSTTDSGVYIKETFGRLAPGAGLDQLFNRNANHPVAPQNTGIPAGATPAYNINAIEGNPAVLASGGNPAQAAVPGVVQSFTYGNIPATIGTFRNPGGYTSDLSVMKSLPFNKDGSRYFQLRIESYNFLNHAGKGPYDPQTSDNTFGYIQTPYNQERHVQVGGRFVF